MNENVYFANLFKYDVPIVGLDNKAVFSKKGFSIIKNILEDRAFLLRTEKNQSQRYEPIFWESQFESNESLKKYIFMYELDQKGQEQIDTIVEEQTILLVTELKYFSVDTDEMSSAERKILDIEEQYSFRILGEILQNIYLQYNDYPNILAGICKGLERFDLTEVKPWGPTMLSGLLNHRNETVKECAVSLVENWADVELLPMLRNLECKSVWLQNYVSDVVRYLEGCKKECFI